MKGIPHVSEDLLEYIERLYPDKSPSLKTPEREVWFRAGQASVAVKLRAVFDEQNENILQGE